MDSIKNLLFKKADSIDESGIRSDLQTVQMEVERYISSTIKVEAISDDRVAFINTHSASVASDIRLQKNQILQSINTNIKIPIKSIRIKIK